MVPRSVVIGDGSQLSNGHVLTQKSRFLLCIFPVCPLACPRQTNLEVQNLHLEVAVYYSSDQQFSSLFMTLRLIVLIRNICK